MSISRGSSYFREIHKDDPLRHEEMSRRGRETAARNRADRKTRAELERQQQEEEARILDLHWHDLQVAFARDHAKQLTAGLPDP